jgi:GT2 family glycosyltransferase
MSEQIDFIVLDLDGGTLLERCLESIRRQSRAPSKIVVVDNGSSVPVRERLARTDDLSIIRSERNLGFAGGVNLAMSQSDSPLVAWINNDCVLDPEWSEQLEAAIVGGAGGAQSIILGPDGSIDGAGIEISGGTFTQTARGLARNASFADPWGVSGTAALFRRAALDSAATSKGPLDERFFAYYEDVELSARLREAGWMLVVVRAPLAIHQGSKTASLLGNRGHWLRIRNRYFVRRLHPAVGRYRSLIAEDLRRAMRSVLRGKLPVAIRTLAAILAGLFHPLARRSDSRS